MSKHPITTVGVDSVSIAPSVLAADFCRLGEEIRGAAAAGAEVVHLDIMDGHFVPNLSFGPPVVSAVRRVTDLPFDVHLMLTNPERYIEPFAAAGGDHITIHVEADTDVAATLSLIRGLGCSSGLCVKPATPAAALAPFMGLIDMILVMTVEPGFGGQSFRRDVVPKIREIRRLVVASGRPIHLQVDGGINAETAAEVVAAGCNMLVAGTSVFRHPGGMREGVDVLRADRRGTAIGNGNE